MEADKDYIFISYSRDDEPKVTPIVEEMRKSGYNVWNDTKILPGEDWTDYIAAHIKDCAVCVAFHSQTSRDSPHCREEIHYALKHKKTVISVYLEDVTLKEGLDMQLARFQSVRYAEPAELLETLRKSPDFECCGGNIPDELSATPQNSVNVKMTLKKAGERFLRIFTILVLFFRKIIFPLCAVSLLIVILVIYGRQTPIWFLDDTSGVLDIISPPFLKVKMPYYNYSIDNYTSGDTFKPPPWAAKRRFIQCAVIRNGVTHIGASAFKDCFGMKFICISESVTSIGVGAFSGCTALKEISFPDSLESLGQKAFEGCTGLERVFIPIGVSNIELYAFSGCTSLKQVYFPWAYADSKEGIETVAGVQGIEDFAFADCTALEEITIPNSIHAISPHAFVGCSNLKTVHIQFNPRKVRIIEDNGVHLIWYARLDNLEDTARDTLYISATAFDYGTKIIFKPPMSDADSFEYIWGSDYMPFDYMPLDIDTVIIN